MIIRVVAAVASCGLPFTVLIGVLADGFLGIGGTPRHGAVKGAHAERSEHRKDLRSACTDFSRNLEPA